MAQIQFQQLPDEPDHIIVFIDGKHLFGEYLCQPDDEILMPKFDRWNDQTRVNAINLIAVILSHKPMTLLQSFSMDINKFAPKYGGN